jgi:hypothetical protein
MLHARMSDAEWVLDAMRSGECFACSGSLASRSSSTARQGHTPREYGATRRILRRLAASGRVDHRDADEQREGDIGGVPVRFAIPDRNGG